MHITPFHLRYVFVGDSIPMDDPCKSCHCDDADGGNVVCTMVACNTCQGTLITVEGSCCGDCKNPTTLSASGCEKDGVHFEFGKLSLTNQTTTEEFQWLEQLWNHVNMFETRE